MFIISGLFSHMVVQRTAGDVSEAVFSGQCTGDGALMARVTRDGKLVSGFDGVPVGQAARGDFSGTLAGLPVGGPYTIELWIDGTGGRAVVEDLLVGDVWMLGGQSNMQGVGRKEGAEPCNPQVRAFYMDDRWDIAQDPLHALCDAVDPVHADLCGGRPERPTDRYVGPGVSFAAEMQRITGVPQGVIASAHGGTSMSQWDPKLKRLGGRSLYGAMLRRFRKNGGKIAGVVWYQGCSDALMDVAPHYTKRMKDLVAAMRKDFGDPTLPVAAVQISWVCGGGWAAEHWNSIQEQQRRLPEVIRNLAVVPAIDLPLDDCIHVSGFGQRRLGRRLAEAMHHLRTGEGLTPITLKRVTLQLNPTFNSADIIVEFDNVVGGLQASGRPHGFELIDDGPHDYIHGVELDGNRAILHTVMLLNDARVRKLYYGYGAAPYCNITDAADRPLPVFGPVPVDKPRAYSDFVKTVQISAFQPSAGKLHTLAYPVDLSTLGFQPRVFPLRFLDIHPEIAQAGDALVYYAARFTCPEPMKLAALLGYDGPVKMWVDGKQIFHDPKGTNPAEVDRTAVRFVAGKGAHEILIALGSNNGMAYGVSLRFERLDVPKRLIAKGGYAMPVMEG
ncbi:MAG: sialate O-acetylesterase [Armatimonadota bacterium]